MLVDRSRSCVRLLEAASQERSVSSQQRFNPEMLGHLTISRWRDIVNIQKPIAAVDGHKPNT